MEIQSLKLIVTNADLTSLVTEQLPDADRIEDLEAGFVPEGVRLKGQYPAPFGFKVPFETLWSVKPAGSLLRVHLESINVAGMPAGLLRGVLLRMIRDALADEPGLSMEEETVVIDVAAAASAQGVGLQVQFTSVTFEEGKAIVEAG